MGVPGAPVPPDFVARAPWPSAKAIRRAYGVSDRAANRWLRETGLTVNSKGGRRPGTIPADFAELAQDMHAAALARHYRAKEDTIRRWLRRLGIKAKKYDFSVEMKRLWDERLPGREPKKPKRRHPVPLLIPALKLPERDGSIGGRAAEHLRKWAPTYRCDETGHADPKGDYWRYGNVVISTTELLARAHAKGWRADTWERIAA